MDNQQNVSIGEKFRQLDARKKEAARQYKEKQKAEQMSNNVFARFNAIRNGTLDDTATEEELELFASVDDPSQLTLDENGRLCLLSGEKKEAPAYEPHKETETSAANRELDALLDARKAAREGGGDTGGTPSAKGYLGDEAVPDEAPVRDGDAQILRIEDLAFNEARIYISFAENEKTREQACGICTQQGSGETRTVKAQGERLFGKSKKAMAYRAAILALGVFTQPGQAIKDITIFMPKELGWELAQNSWNLTTQAYDLDADLYSQIFKMCAAQGIKIHMAPDEDHGHFQGIARKLAEALVRNPA